MQIGQAVTSSIRVVYRTGAHVGQRSKTRVKKAPRLAVALSDRLFIFWTVVLGGVKTLGATVSKVCGLILPLVGPSKRQRNDPARFGRRRDECQSRRNDAGLLD